MDIHIPADRPGGTIGGAKKGAHPLLLGEPGYHTDHRDIRSPGQFKGPLQGLLGFGFSLHVFDTVGLRNKRVLGGVPNIGVYTVEDPRIIR